MRRSIANKWWLSVWCYLIEDSPTRLLKSDANPNWDLTTNSALICVSQDFLWRNLQSGSSWQTSDSTNSSTNCQLVHGFAASIYFEKARIAFYFIIFHGVSQQRYLRNLTNFRNQANTSRLLCYVFFACMLTNTYQLRWANNWAKRKRGAFSIQPISILLQYFDIYKSYQRFWQFIFRSWKQQPAANSLFETKIGFADLDLISETTAGCV